MQIKPLRYSRSVTFGRFNIPHSGHVELVQMMLEHSDVANIYISAGKANNDWALRALMFSRLCRAAGVDLKRVNFLKSNSPFEAVQNTVDEAEYNEAVIVLGSDQQDMARKLAEMYDCATVINRRTNSSTQMRFFLDAEDFREDLVHLYNGDEFSTALAMILRKEERNRERSYEAAAAAA